MKFKFICVALATILSVKPFVGHSQLSGKLGNIVQDAYSKSHLKTYSFNTKLLYGNYIHQSTYYEQEAINTFDTTEFANPQPLVIDSNSFKKAEINAQNNQFPPLYLKFSENIQKENLMVKTFTGDELVLSDSKNSQYYILKRASTSSCSSALKIKDDFYGIHWKPIYNNKTSNHQDTSTTFYTYIRKNNDTLTFYDNMLASMGTDEYKLNFEYEIHWDDCVMIWHLNDPKLSIQGEQLFKSNAVFKMNNVSQEAITLFPVFNQYGFNVMQLQKF